MLKARVLLYARRDGFDALATEIRAPVWSVEVTGLRIETRVALGAIVIPTRCPWRRSVSHRPIIEGRRRRRRRNDVDFARMSALPRIAPMPNPARPAPTAEPLPACVGNTNENTDNPIVAFATATLKPFIIGVPQGRASAFAAEALLTEPKDGPKALLEGHE